MVRGGHSPVATVPALPKVSFQKIEDDVSTQPGGVHDGQARTFGYNDFSEFQRPDQYIRHIEPLEVDLERQVEYDMDEQDQEWLDAVNTERKKEQLDKVTYEVFEVVMDRLEKEWFNLTKHIPKPDLALPSEDSTCAICDDSEGENSNAIVFCDGCNLASCILCPNEGGAFKQTTQGDWIHLLCAIWIPETRVSNDTFMEPIIGVDKITKSRWKLKCMICENREGACIQCAKQSCFLAFHVTCARKEKLLSPMKSAQGSEPGALTAYCDRHLPKEQAEIREAAKQAEAEEEENEDQYNNAKLSKSARAYAKTYKPGPPLVPAIMIDRILQYISRTTIRKKPDFIALMCRYWSLKREARRGAPLLKRLHLEPWTASTGAKMQGEEEKVMKLEQLQHLRKDLEDLRNLTELSRKRESRKLRQAEVVQDVLFQALFLHVPKLRLAFEKITALDRSDYFKNPVNRKDVPDYFDIVKNPMSWSNIEHKLDNYKYWDIQSFKDDIELVLDNAVLYNKEGTPFHRTALRIRVAAQPILAELNQLSFSPHLRSSEETDGTPPLEILELLLSTDAIKDESELILSADPITSLFNFELEKKKPLPPPPTPPPKPVNPRTEKRRLARAVEKEKRALREQARREASASQGSSKDQTASAPPDIRVPRTRSAIAAANAFEAEAEASGSGSVSAPPRRPKAGKVSALVPEEVAKNLRQRRASAPIPAPGDIPLVDRVDERDSFTMFEQGWILPAGQRRGGRVPVDRSAAPPPKKKMRLDRGASRLSVFSTAASENQTLKAGSPHDDDIRGSSSVPRDADNSMDVDGGERPPSKRNAATRSGDSATPRLHSLAVVTPERVAIPPPNVIRTPDGKVIIEELDTPAIRKEKRRLEKDRLAAEAAAAAPSSLSDAEPLSPMSSSASEEGADDADAEATSELSELSDEESDEERGKTGRQIPLPGEQGDTEKEPDREEELTEEQTREELAVDSELDALEAEKELEAEKVPEKEQDEPKAAREVMELETEKDAEKEQDELEAARDVREVEVDAPEGEANAPQGEPEGQADVPGRQMDVSVGDMGALNGEENAAEVRTGTVEEEMSEHDAPEVVKGTGGEDIHAQDREADAQAVEEEVPDGPPDAPEVEMGVPEDEEMGAPVGGMDEPAAEMNVLEQEMGLLEQAMDLPEQGMDAPEQDILTSEQHQDKSAGKISKSIASASTSQPLTRARHHNKDLGRLKAPPGHKKVEAGTLVSFPWWPAVIVDDADDRIPVKVLEETKAERKKRKGKDWLYIIRFYDKMKSWQYLPLDKMRELGESKGIVSGNQHFDNMGD
ncbi:hypothetical protein B0H11DRAFT_2006185 [Mycena galericulata]|nr:hypothetical protein B0H11DRAFT_2006185 [Mycena galericulata]